MSLTSYRAAPPRGGGVSDLCGFDPAGWPGGDLLSRALRHSTMGAEAFHGRVRDGIGCSSLAMATGPPSRIRSLVHRCEVMKGDIEEVVSVSRMDAACGVLSCDSTAISRVEIDRAIRTARLHPLPGFHLRPIDVMVYHGP